MKYNDIIKYDKQLNKRIDRLFNGKYIFLTNIIDYLNISLHDKNYGIGFSILVDNINYQKYIQVIKIEGNDLKELGNNLIKEIKKAMKKGYFYTKGVDHDIYTNFNDLVISKTFIS